MRRGESDTEQVPLLYEGGIEGFLRREVLPYAPDAWHDPASVRLASRATFPSFLRRHPCTDIPRR